MSILLMGRIYELRHSVWLRCLDIRTISHKIFSPIQNVAGGDTHTGTQDKHTDSKAIS
jgi:hypothetical protein